MLAAEAKRHKQHEIAALFEKGDVQQAIDKALMSKIPKLQTVAMQYISQNAQSLDPLAVFQSLIEAIPYMQSDELQLKLLQISLPLYSSMQVEGESLGEMFNMLLKLNQTAVVMTTMKQLVQMVIVQRRVRPIDAFELRYQNIQPGLADLSPAELDGYLIVHDLLCLATEGSPLLLRVEGVSKQVIGELVESVLLSLTLLKQPLVELFKQKLFPFVLHLLGLENLAQTRNNSKEVADRIALQKIGYRLSFQAVNVLVDLLPEECGLVMSLLAQLCLKSKDVWALETIHQLVKNAPLILRIFKKLDSEEWQEVVEALRQVVMQQVTGVELSFAQVMPRTPYLSQIGKSTPSIAYPKLLALQCIMRIVDCLSVQSMSDSLKVGSVQFNFNDKNHYEPDGSQIVVIIGLENELVKLCLQSISLLLEDCMEHFVNILEPDSLQELIRKYMHACIASAVLNDQNMLLKLTMKLAKLISVAGDEPVGVVLLRTLICIAHCTQSRLTPEHWFVILVSLLTVEKQLQPANSVQRINVVQGLIRESIHYESVADLFTALAWLGQQNVGISQATTPITIEQVQMAYPYEFMEELLMVNLNRFFPQFADLPPVESPVWDAAINHLCSIVAVQDIKADVRVTVCAIVSNMSNVLASKLEQCKSDRLQRQILEPLLMLVKTTQMDVYQLTLDTLTKLLQVYGQDFTAVGFRLVFQIMAELAASDTSFKLIRNAFPSMQLICSDFLHVLDKECFILCMSSLLLFVQQERDVNVSLSSISQLWSVCEFIKQPSSLLNKQDSDDLQIKAIELYALMTSSQQHQISLAAVQTLFRTVTMTFGQNWSKDKWLSILEQTVLPCVQECLMKVDGQISKVHQCQVVKAEVVGFEVPAQESFDAAMASKVAGQPNEETEALIQSTLRHCAELKQMVLTSLSQLLVTYSEMLLTKDFNHVWQTIIDIISRSAVSTQHFGSTVVHGRHLHDLTKLSIDQMLVLLQSVDLLKFEFSQEFLLYICQAWVDCCYRLHERKLIAIQVARVLQVYGNVDGSEFESFGVFDHRIREELLVYFVQLGQCIYSQLYKLHSMSLKSFDVTPQLVQSLLYVLQFYDLRVEELQSQVKYEVSLISRQTIGRYKPNSKTDSAKTSSIQLAVLRFLFGQDVLIGTAPLVSSLVKSFSSMVSVLTVASSGDVSAFVQELANLLDMPFIDLYCDIGTDIMERNSQGFEEYQMMSGQLQEVRRPVSDQTYWDRKVMHDTFKYDAPNYMAFTQELLRQIDLILHESKISQQASIRLLSTLQKPMLLKSACSYISCEGIWNQCTELFMYVAVSAPKSPSFWNQIVAGVDSLFNQGPQSYDQPDYEDQLIAYLNQVLEIFVPLMDAQSEKILSVLLLDKISVPQTLKVCKLVESDLKHSFAVLPLSGQKLSQERLNLLFKCCSGPTVQTSYRLLIKKSTQLIQNWLSTNHSTFPRPQAMQLQIHQLLNGLLDLKLPLNEIKAPKDSSATVQSMYADHSDIAHLIELFPLFCQLQDDKKLKDQVQQCLLQVAQIFGTMK